MKFPRITATACRTWNQANKASATTPDRRQSIAMVASQKRGTSLRFLRRAGRSGAASMNDELANSLDRLAGPNAELANSTGRSSADSESQVKTWVCLKAGRVELTAQIVSNAPLRAHPAIEGRRCSLL
jgi:hypothetical protein